MKKNIVLSLVFLVSVCSYAQNTLKDGTAASVGMSADRLRRIDDLFQDHINKKWLPGAVAVVARNGVIAYHQSAGTSGIGNDQPMKKNDIFRIASMTKPIVSIAMLMLLEEGKYMLDEPISKYIPSFKEMTVLKDFNEKDTTYTSVPAKKPITIRQLFSHTSGIAYGFTAKHWGMIYGKAKVVDLASMENIRIGEKINLLAKMPLAHEPGEKFTYGLNTDVLGYLVEILSGMNLSDFCEKRIFQPIGMNDTHFFWPEAADARLVRMYGDSKDTGLNFKYLPNIPDVTRMNYPVKGAKTYFSGGSGLSSTALDYAKFLQMVLNGGTYNGTRLVSRKTIELMTTNQIGELTLGGGVQFGLGFSILSDKGTFKQLSSVGRLGWGGAFNTTFWIDPKEKMVAVLMTQIYPSAHQQELYAKFETAVYQAIND